MLRNHKQHIHGNQPHTKHSSVLHSTDLKLGDPIDLLSSKLSTKSDKILLLLLKFTKVQSKRGFFRVNENTKQQSVDTISSMWSQQTAYCGKG